jgi:hypothetical protein
MLIMGWDGTEVTPQIKNLIEHHHLGSILLTAKNLKCKHPVPQTHWGDMSDVRDLY